MLKRRIFQAALLSSILLVGCEATNDEPEESSLSPTTDEAENEQETVDSNEESTDESEDPIEEENVEEETEYLYRVSDNYATIQPLEESDANERVVLLTYDDAPDTYTLEIANTLLEHEAPAIFFVNGIFIDRENGEEVLQEIHDMGFEIGNHGYTHANLTTLSEEEQYEEIISTSDRIEEVTGERPRFFRAPFGANTDFSTQTALEDGMMLMNWTYGFDWEAEYQDPTALADIMVEPITPEGANLLVPGSNLLMHDREWTKDATPAIIEGLREKDYELLDPSLIQSVEEMNEEQNEQNEESEDVDE
jgi:peptidoglycan/xylan/chitin deacetylase (PgdA/CDA1 family)